MTDFRTVLDTTLESERLFAAAVAVSVAEAGIRLLLAVVVHPIAFVLWPPVVAAVGMALVVPTARTEAGLEPPTPEPGDGIGLRRVPSLLAVAVAGHAVALALGAALFLLVDTPIRYTLYLAGYGDAITDLIVILTPLPGVGVGTVIAWAIPAIAVVRVAGGVSARVAVLEALSTTFERPRAVGVVAVCNGVFAVVTVSILAGGVFGSEPLLPTDEFAASFVLLAAGLSVPIVWTIGFAFGLTLLVHTVPFTSPPRRGRPIARVVLIGFVLAALVTTAGAVRMAEVRPVDTAPDPLPDDPDGLYATALENTERTSHAHRTETIDGEVSTVSEVAIDRENRRFLQTGVIGHQTQRPVQAYVSSSVADSSSFDTSLVGLGSRELDDGSTVVAAPGYVSHAPHYDLEGGWTATLSSTATGWEVRERTDEEVVLELSDPDDVLGAMRPNADRYEFLESNQSRLVVTVDANRETVREAELRLEGTFVDHLDREQDIDAHVRHEFDVDVEVDRPDELGDPTPGEWFWRLFAY